MLLPKSSQVCLFILASILLGVEGLKEVWTCETKTDQDCVFPFKFNGKTYENCTTDALVDSQTPNAWCATETDGSGAMVEGKFGECDLTTCEYVKTGFNPGGVIGGLTGGLVAVGAAIGSSIAYMKKKQKGCYRNSV